MRMMVRIQEDAVMALACRETEENHEKLQSA
jgi:hypothetical protein